MEVVGRKSETLNTSDSVSLVSTTFDRSNYPWISPWLCANSKPVANWIAQS